LETETARGAACFGSGVRANRAAAEKAALLALEQCRRPGSSGTGAARTPERDALLGSIGDGDRARRLRGK
jgi:hypothetical protein